MEFLSSKADFQKNNNFLDEKDKFKKKKDIFIPDKHKTSSKNGDSEPGGGSKDENEEAASKIDGDLAKKLRISAGTKKKETKEIKAQIIKLNKENSEAELVFKSRESESKSLNQVNPKSIFINKTNDEIKEIKNTNNEKINSLKKEKNEKNKKVFRKTAASRALQAKKEMQNETGDMSGGTGDIFHDANTGILKIATDILKEPLQKIKNKLMLIGLKFFMWIALFCAVFVLFTSAITVAFSLFNSDEGESLDGISGDGVYIQSAMSDEQIQGVLDSTTFKNGQQNIVIKFALSKVGYPYSQALRTSGKAYDCSSLAYYAWKEAGIDIGCTTAATQAQKLEKESKIVSSDDLQVGDLVYYGGKSNGRYKGIYHVAIYAGNGKCVEALGAKWGVVYEDLRTNKVVMICRPNKE